MTNEEFREMINDKTAFLSKEELEVIIEKELEKSEFEMDADLIEYCLDELSNINLDIDFDVVKEKDGDTNGKHIKRRCIRIVAIAAAVALMVVGTVSVYALVFNVDLFNGIIEYYDDHIRIRFDNSYDKADKYKLLGTEFAEELANNGISPVFLPEDLFSNKCKILSLEYEKTDAIMSVNVSFEYQHKKGYIYISHYASANLISPTDYLNTNGQIESVNVSGITIYIMEQNKKGTIAYKDGLTEYIIVTELSFKEAIEFAQTAK
ncbi:MAG: hypothetical protein MJ168_08415 [Clostridia bacterium]|nr:hypothetical protein [Clostridia bacterium]